MSETQRRLGRDSDGTLRPWEKPGNVRRDFDPDRGLLLLALGGVSLLFGFATVFLSVPALLALPLGIAASRMAAHDLRQMRLGQMDPAGRRWAVLAQLWGIVGAGLSFLFWVPFAAMYLMQMQ
jgi:hypothetical protein